MSLKAFHIVFIALSILLAVGFGIWVLISDSGMGSIADLAAALLSFAVAGALILYGVRFLRKFKHLRYM
jgi:hypothetical protein